MTHTPETFYKPQRRTGLKDNRLPGERVNIEYYRNSENILRDLQAFIEAFKITTNNESFSVLDLPDHTRYGYPVYAQCADGKSHEWNSYLNMAIYHLSRQQGEPGKPLKYFSEERRLQI